MKIYDYAGFPNPARIRIALHEKGAAGKVEFVTVDVPSGEHRTPDFRAKNPSASVPVLELDDGECISECTAITEYIDHAFEGAMLTGSGARQRAEIHMMQRRAEQYVLDAVGGYFHHATEGLGPELETDQNPEWGNRQRTIAVEGMAYFDGVLAAKPMVAGDTFSMADITLFAGLGFAEFATIDIPAECRHLIAWRERIAARPSVLAATG